MAREILSSNIALGSQVARSQESACRENRCADKLLPRGRAAPFYLASGSSQPLRPSCVRPLLWLLHIGRLPRLLFGVLDGVRQKDKWPGIPRLIE